MGFQVQGRLIPGVVQMYDIKPLHITIALVILTLTIGWIHISDMSSFSLRGRKVKPLDFPLPQKYCSVECPASIPSSNIHQDPSSEACPEYFRWIHEDLGPWKGSGITREATEAAKKVAHLRVIIIQGRVYVQKFKKVFQTRDIITVWGILQLLTLYPGKVPDVDLMFECNDFPVILKKDYQEGNSGSIPPPVFHYCGDDSSFDIVFPDWSFWGWPELNIRPWEFLKRDLEQGNHVTNWLDRNPYAYWKGNTKLGQARQELIRCNVSGKQDWGARVFDMEWHTEKKGGFRTSDLANQCDYRYKIYVEGKSWSVSEKYILGCDSMTLIVAPQFYDFFTRNLIPTLHYWPIGDKDKCNAIKFAVDWGNQNPSEVSGRDPPKLLRNFLCGFHSLVNFSNVDPGSVPAKESLVPITEQAQDIGKAASKFIQEQLRMKFVYDYMFHLLNEYAKLLKYEPTIPDDVVEVCSDNMLCGARGLRKSFRVDSRVNGPANESACILPPPFDQTTLQSFLMIKEKLIQEVEMTRQFS